MTCDTRVLAVCDQCAAGDCGRGGDAALGEKTVYDKSQNTLGYDVTYKIGNQQGKIRMDHDPGTQIPLDKSGQLVLTKA